MNQQPRGARLAPSLERTIFANLPLLAGLSVAILCVLRLAFPFVISLSGGAPSEKSLQLLDFELIGIGAAAFLLLLAAGLASGIVLLMKGPRRTADSYELKDFDRPA